MSSLVGDDAGGRKMREKGKRKELVFSFFAIFFKFGGRDK